MDIELLAMSKRAGLSFEEINQFRIVDLLDFVNAYAGKSKEKPRKAKQKDINNFYAN